MCDEVFNLHVAALQIGEEQFSHVLMGPVGVVGRSRGRIAAVGAYERDSAPDDVAREPLVRRRARVPKQEHLAKSPSQRQGRRQHRRIAGDVVHHVRQPAIRNRCDGIFGLTRRYGQRVRGPVGLRQREPRRRCVDDYYAIGSKETHELHH